MLVGGVFARIKIDKSKVFSHLKLDMLKSSVSVYEHKLHAGNQQLTIPGVDRGHGFGAPHRCTP